MIGFHFIASPDVGTGHARRCAVLAQELALAGHKIALYSDEGTLAFSKNHMPVATQFITIGFDLKALIETVKKSDLEVLVLDRYDLDITLESTLRKHVSRLMVIDDYAGRDHECDILLDQNMGRTIEDWPALKNSDTQILAGAEYALLRPEFRDFWAKRPKIDTKTAEKKTVFICFGGLDIKNVTLEVTKALLGQFKEELYFDIVIGSGSLNLDQLIALVKKTKNSGLHIDCPDVSIPMSQAIIAIGAPGSMTLERCCLHLPSILISLADNQHENGKMAEEMGIARYLGDYTADVIPEILETLDHCLNTQDILPNMSAKARDITDGRGAQRVISHIKLELNK